MYRIKYPKIESLVDGTSALFEIYLKEIGFKFDRCGITHKYTILSKLENLVGDLKKEIPETEHPNPETHLPETNSQEKPYVKNK